MTDFRKEHDLLGEINVAKDALWGAHTERAIANFPKTGRLFHRDFVKAYATVKRACAMANGNIGILNDDIVMAIGQACMQLEEGLYNDSIVVEPLAGGAGTSVNMNFNEVIANLANRDGFNKDLGTYSPIDPLNTVNLHQSTNDTFPTATRLAALWMLERLEVSLTSLQAAFQAKEDEFADIVLVGRTQLQDAVPMTMGQVLSSWAEAIARDRWRVFKSIERIKVVNIGGTAIGTGIGAPRNFIFKVIDILRTLTGLPLTRAENPVEATSNQDSIVEVSGIMSALATNLLKIANDLRIYSSTTFGELTLPPVQAGSSIMPAKVNPVIPEYVSQLAITAINNHNTLSIAIGNGNLQLSQLFPLASWLLLDELNIMTNAVNILRDKCIPDLKANEKKCKEHLENSKAFASALVPKIGYENVEKAILKSIRDGVSLRETLIEFGATPEMIKNTLAPSTLRKLGSSDGGHPTLG